MPSHSGPVGGRGPGGYLAGSPSPLLRAVRGVGVATAERGFASAQGDAGRGFSGRHERNTAR